MITREDIDTLRSIARAGADYGTVKRSLSERSWQVDEDDVELGFVRVFIPGAADECYRLIIAYRDPAQPPYWLLTFFLCPDSDEHLAAFNAAFQSAAEALTRHLGAPTASGEHRLSFRTWPYAYRRWSLPEAEFTLVQDELDVQDGMDVTLWAQPVGTPIEQTLRL